MNRAATAPEAAATGHWQEKSPPSRDFSHVIVHTPGKVGTNSILSSIRASIPDICCEYSHCLNPARLHDGLKGIINLPDTERYRDFKASMLRQAETTMALLEVLKNPEARIMVVTGMRNPFDHMLSAIFHHARILFPKLFDPGISEDRLYAMVIASIERLYKEYIRPGKPCDHPVDRLIVYNLHVAFSWWEEDYLPAHGIDIYSVPPAADGLWAQTIGNKTFVLYQLERIREVIPWIIGQLAPDAPVSVIHGNDSRLREGAWGAVYRRMKSQYRPSPGFQGYYADHPFTRKFYPDWGRGVVRN
jgi:hypothetical protein